MIEPATDNAGVRSKKGYRSCQRSISYDLLHKIAQALQPLDMLSENHLFLRRRFGVRMQTPQVPRPFLNGRVGYFVALTGSAISLFSFCAFPFGYTCFFVFCSSLSFWQQLVQGNMLSWALLVVLIITCILPLIGILLIRSSALAISLIVFGIIGTGLFLWAITRVANIPNTSIAMGIWLCFFGMIVAAIGGVAAITGSRYFHPPIPI